jgi:hypothetical protein
MPIKSEHEPQIGIMIDGEFKPIKEIPTLDTATLETTDVSKYDYEIFKGGSGSFTCTCFSENALRHIMSEDGYRIYCHIHKSNNYCKRHGIPMRRKVRC